MCQQLHNRNRTMLARPTPQCNGNIRCVGREILNHWFQLVYKIGKQWLLDDMYLHGSMGTVMLKVEVPRLITHVKQRDVRTILATPTSDILVTICSKLLFVYVLCLRYLILITIVYLILLNYNCLILDTNTKY